MYHPTHIDVVHMRINLNGFDYDKNKIQMPRT